MVDMTEKDGEKLEEFKQDIVDDANVVQDQQEDANEDMRFVNVTGASWEDYFGLSNTNNSDKRIKLEFNIAVNYLRRNLGKWNQNRVGLEYKSDDLATTDDDAELLNGIYRADYRQNSGKIAVDNAVNESSTCGIGAYQIATFFEDDEDPENDNQRVEFRPIYNAYNTVYWDSASKRIDKKDADRVTKLLIFTDKSYEKRWPDAAKASAFTPQTRFFTGFDRFAPNLIYIGVRYEIVKEKELFFIYDNLQTGKQEIYSEKDHELIKDELRKDEFKTFKRERKKIIRHVDKTIFSGQEILEQTKRIVGKWLPIIPMYGYRAFVDGSERYQGLIRNLKDAARLFNMQVSKLAENSASSGSDTPFFYPEQVEGHENNLADMVNKPYQLINPVIDKDGNIVTSGGPITYLKSAQLDASTATLMQVVPDFVRDYTGMHPQETTNPNASGKAIREARKIEDLNTQVISDNRATSIEWGGVVYQSVASEIYSTKRIVNTIGADGVDGQEMLLKTVLDEDTGKLVESNNLSGKKFRVYSDVGPQYSTLKEETVENFKGMLELLRDIPQGAEYINPIISTILINTDGPGVGPLKDLVRRNMILQGQVDPETEEEKQMLAQVQENANQPDPQEQLIEAAAKQAEGEARERESKVLVNAADANKKQAETQKILSDINVTQQTADDSRIKTLADIRNQVFQNAQIGPLQ